MSSLLAFGDISVSFEIWDGLSRIADQDRDLMMEIEARKSLIKRDRLDLQKKEHTLRKTQIKKMSKFREQKTKQKDFRDRRKKLMDDKGALDSRAKQYAQENKQIQMFINILVNKSKGIQADMEMMKKAFKKLKGKLYWPLSIKAVKSVRNFGKYKDELTGTMQMNKGIDIVTESYQSVLAVARGEIVFADWYGRMGNMIIVDHGGNYFTLYGHLTEQVLLRKTGLSFASIFSLTIL